jgi:hypothetical protein
MMGSAAKEVVLVLLVELLCFSGGVVSSKSSAFLFPLFGVAYCPFLRIEGVPDGSVGSEEGKIEDEGDSGAVGGAGGAGVASATRPKSVMAFCSGSALVKALGNGSLGLALRWLADLWNMLLSAVVLTCR